MQRAEVWENFSVLLASSKEITWRIGCERHGFIKIYMDMAGQGEGSGGTAGEVSATQAFLL